MFVLFEQAAHAVSPDSCKASQVDSTCAGGIGGGWRTGFPDDERRSTLPLAGQPGEGYWFWGYDFRTPDADQSSMPLFVNRSGLALRLTLTFRIPAGECFKDCLPGVIFYSGSSRITDKFPKLDIDGTQASATLDIGIHDSYGWIIALWKATGPDLTVVTSDGEYIPFDIAGLPARPDQSTLVAGVPQQCTCQDGSVVGCMLGDHYSNGLSGQWSKAGLVRINAWTQCGAAGT